MKSLQAIQNSLPAAEGRVRARHAYCVLRLAAFAATMALPLHAHALISYAELRRSHQPSEVQALARDGTPIGAIRTDYKQRRAAWLSLEQFSPALIDTVVRVEDQRFFEHGGVDWRAVAGASAGTVRRGASTLTMQLAGLLAEDLAQRKGGRSVLQKIDQAATALAIERQWTKAQILEAYLNRVPLRGELLGVPAASQALFGKAPHGLDKTEAAILTALLRGPNATPQLVAQRTCRILHGAADAPQCGLMEGTVRLVLAGGRSVAPLMIAQHAAQKAAKAGTLQTTLDARLQRLASESLKRHVLELAKQNVEDGAVLVLDNATGQVLAWVGSTGALSDAAQVDFVTARRQAGSTLKPFLYAQALAENRLTAASLIDDSPINLTTAAGLYMPQNYDRQFTGPVSVRTALASSLNIPAVRTAVMVSPERFFRTLKQLGFSLRESGDYFGYSIALGSAEVSLLELTNAYRALANDGRYSEAQMSLQTSSATRAVFAPQTSFIINDILSDETARVHTFGLNNALVTRGWAAVKTGTSKDMRDNWCIGFSDRYTVGVWVGNATGDAMWNVSGVHGAAPVWNEVMAALHAGKPSRPPRAPAGLERRRIAFDQQREPERDEWFIAGTQRTSIALSTAAQPAIVTPADGTIVGLDPDIPPLRQRLTLNATGVREAIWRVDGKLIGKGVLLYWMPQPGKHRISLHDAAGTELAQVHVQVRGAFSKVAVR